MTTYLQNRVDRQRHNGYMVRLLMAGEDRKTADRGGGTMLVATHSDGRGGKVVTERLTLVGQSWGWDMFPLGLIRFG